MTLRERINKILLNHPETRDSDKKLQWRVLTELNLVENYSYSFDTGITYGKLCITEENFMKAPAFESVRRCRQQLQRSDLLIGRNEIQPTEKVKRFREDEAKFNGYNFISSQGEFII